MDSNDTIYTKAMQDILKNLKKTGEDCYRIVCLIALYTKYHITKKNIIINQLIEF